MALTSTGVSGRKMTFCDLSTRYGSLNQPLFI